MLIHFSGRLESNVKDTSTYAIDTDIKEIHMGLRPAADPKEIPFMSVSIECVDVSLTCFQAAAEKCLSTRNSPKLLISDRCKVVIYFV